MKSETRSDKQPSNSKGIGPQTGFNQINGVRSIGSTTSVCYLQNFMSV